MNGFGIAVLALQAADEAGRSPNNAAGVAGFALVLLWVLVAAVQVFRHRRRQRRRLTETVDEPVPPASSP